MPPPASGILGLLLLLGVAVGTFMYLRFSSTASRRGVGFFIYLGLFIMLTAILTSLCRINYGLEEASTIRYRLPALIFWSCVIALTSSLFLSRVHLAYSSLGTPIGALLFIVLALVPDQRSTIAYFAGVSREIHEDSLALAINASDRTCSELFRLRPDLVRSYSPFLRQSHLSLFAVPSFHGN